MGYRREGSVAAGILRLAGKIIIYLAVGFLLYEGVTKGYAFGYEVFILRQWKRNLGRTGP